MPTQTIERVLQPETMDVSGEELRWKIAREIGHRLLAESGREALPANERALTEIDNLNRLRRADGSHDPKVLADTRANLVTRVVEPSMPYAVSTTYQEYRDGNFYWLDQTGPQAAASGLRYHKHQSARERVVVEVAEALDLQDSLSPGLTKVLLSPRMSPKDAPKAVAQAEHLADDDMIRIHWLDTDVSGNIKGKFMQAILVRDIPLESWVAMLASPNNIFGKSIKVQDPRSALSVMKTFTELDLSSEKLPEGAVTILQAVMPFIADPKVRQQVAQTLPRYRENQQLMRQVASDVADRWLQFEVALADSLAAEESNQAIEQFIDGLSARWNDDDVRMLNAHRLQSGRYYMTRQLALRLEEAKQNVLWAQAGVMVGNERITQQMSASVAAQILMHVSALHEMMRQGQSMQQLAALESQAANLSASQNVKVSGGCPGSSDGNFKQEKSGSTESKDDEPKSSKEESSDEACDYQHSGCYCSPYDDLGRPLLKPMTVTARRESNGSAHCLRIQCGAKLGPNGKPVSKGGVYARAMALQKMQDVVSDGSVQREQE